MKRSVEIVSQNKRINLIGDIFCDIVSKNVANLPTWGTDTLSDITIMAGGSCLNSIVHAKSYEKFSGLNTTLDIFSAVGQDIQGSCCIKTIESNNINTSHIIQSLSYKTGTCIVISGSSDRSFITDRGCVSLLSSTFFDFTQLSNCDHFHIAGYFNCDQLRKESKDLLKQV